jgi:hypothetical protein
MRAPSMSRSIVSNSWTRTFRSFASGQGNIGIQILLCVGVFAVLCLRTLVYQCTHIHEIRFADDAFYYFIVAHNLAGHGISTFDGTKLTNGYHPLWMALLVLQFKALGESLLLTRCIEFLLSEAALVFTLLLVRLPSVILNILFTAGFFAILSRISLNGMETALFVFCFALFTYVSTCHSEETLWGGVVDGLLAAAVIASRIDAVVFVLPQMLLTARSWSRRVASLLVVMLCGGVYAVVNLHYFGMPVPISGEVKSLGGLQVNWALLRYLQDPGEPPSVFFYATAILFILSLFLLRRSRPHVHRPIVAAFLLGSIVYAIRLAFLSSWIIWSWYDYPLMIGYIACVPSLVFMVENQIQERNAYRKLVPIAAVALLLVVPVSLLKSLHDLRSVKLVELSAADADVPQTIAKTLEGARVAMGDRAGSFAYHYPGSVNQLEGLMNDDEYLRMLRGKKDVTDLLCGRKVQFVIAYEPDLANYKVHLVHTIRPELSQYTAPEIQVLRQDQVIQMPDLSPGRPGGAATYLYVWRLRCEVPQERDVRSSRVDPGPVGNTTAARVGYPQ